MPICCWNQWLDVHLLGGDLIIWGPSRMCKRAEGHLARPRHVNETSNVTQGS